MKNDIKWIRVTVYTSSYGIEHVCAVLYNLGITGVEIEDYNDFKNFLEENRASWDYVDEELEKEKSGESCVKFYLADDSSVYETLNFVRNSLSVLKKSDEDNLFGRLTISTDSIQEEDWCNNWKQYFKPLYVGDNILICPEWEDIPENSDKTVFKINPGMSFGTGSHETTQLCLEELEKYIKPGHSVLDLGCGSGILSIIAMLLGAEDSTAVDIDPYAVGIAMENAKQNNILSDKYHTIAGNIISDIELSDKLSKKNYDIVFANIVADVIIALKPIFDKLLSKNTILITSGIINTRLEDVLAEYENSNLEIIRIRHKGEWVLITFKKR